MNHSKPIWVLGSGEVDKPTILQYGKVLDVELPDKYVEITAKNDGAHPKPSVFDIEGREEAVFNNLLQFNPVRGPNIFELYDQLRENANLNRVFPFARDPFGNLICFDYRNTKSDPSIVFWDHESDPDAGEDPLKFVANSFDEFLDMLYEPED